MPNICWGSNATLPRRPLVYGHLYLYTKFQILYANSEGSCKTAQMCWLTWTFAIRLCGIKEPFSHGPAQILNILTPEIIALIMPPASKLEGHIAFGLSVHVSFHASVIPLFTLFDACHILWPMHARVWNFIYGFLMKDSGPIFFSCPVMPGVMPLYITTFLSRNNRFGFYQLCWRLNICWKMTSYTGVKMSSCSRVVLYTRWHFLALVSCAEIPIGYARMTFQ